MDSELKICIFCFRDNTELAFSREHIIPQNVGGNLFIDEVCVECNSVLGTQVDIQVLKYREILNAFKVLNIPHDKSSILRNYYNVKGESGDLTFSATYRDGEYTMVPKAMPDGSIIVPEENYKDAFEKMVKRDDRIKSINSTEDYLNDEIKNITNRYTTAQPGDFLQAPSIGRALLKRREKVEFFIKSKGRSDIFRLIAKMLYEMMYFAGGRFVFDNARALQPIIHLINSGKLTNSFHFSKEKPVFDKPIATHMIRFNFRNNLQEIYISFFGVLDFKLLTFLHYSDFWRITESQLKCNNILGLHIEQSVKTGQKKFGIVDTEGKLVNTIA